VINGPGDGDGIASVLVDARRDGNPRTVACSSVRNREPTQTKQVADQNETGHLVRAGHTLRGVLLTARGSLRTLLAASEPSLERGGNGTTIGEELVRRVDLSEIWR
jgi:hypothetical protein